MDFKNTSSSIPSSKLTLKAEPKPEDELGDFQMPMYLKLWEANSGDEISSARFVPIKIKSFEEEGKEVIVKEGRPTTTCATREDFIKFTIPLFDEYVEKMCGAIKAANYSLQNVKVENCAGKAGGYPCDYRMICRTVYNTAGLKIISESSAEEN